MPEKDHLDIPCQISTYLGTSKSVKPCLKRAFGILLQNLHIRLVSLVQD